MGAKIYKFTLYRVSLFSTVGTMQRAQSILEANAHTKEGNNQHADVQTHTHTQSLRRMPLIATVRIGLLLLCIMVFKGIKVL